MISLKYYFVISKCKNYFIITIQVATSILYYRNIILLPGSNRLISFFFSKNCLNFSKYMFRYLAITWSICSPQIGHSLGYFKITFRNLKIRILFPRNNILFHQNNILCPRNKRFMLFPRIIVCYYHITIWFPRNIFFLFSYKCKYFQMFLDGIRNCTLLKLTVKFLAKMIYIYIFMSNFEMTKIKVFITEPTCQPSRYFHNIFKMETE